MSIEESHQPEPITGAGSTAPQDPSPATKKKAPPGASWKNDEAHVLPKNRLGIVRRNNHSLRLKRLICHPFQVFAGLMCTVFLAAIDQVRCFGLASKNSFPTSVLRPLLQRHYLPSSVNSEAERITVGLERMSSIVISPLRHCEAH
jgi:hypothetical protein